MKFKEKKTEEKVNKLLAKMTIREKIGQLRQPGVSLVGAFDVPFDELLNMMFDGKITEAEFHKMMANSKMDYRDEEVRRGDVGSFNGITGAEITAKVQENAIKSRLGIPLLFGLDVIHGYSTVYPIPLALSGSFEPELYRRCAKMAADEASSVGVNWTFAPMVDVARDARWGRISEGAGEDPYLAGVFAANTVKGFQGENLEELSDGHHILACAKHFAAYGKVESGRDYNEADLSEQRLYENYLPPFKAAVDAGVATLMPAFNDINGVPCSVNKKLLTDVLRKDWGFDGFLISDANAIAECVTHGIAEDKKDAARQAVNAGMDMDMGSDSFFNNMESLVKEGKVKEETLDEAVRRILRVKFALGLFERPVSTSPEREKATLGKKEHVDLVREAAEKSIVLLKNEGDVLPAKKKPKKVAVIGWLAGDAQQMYGSWATPPVGSPSCSVVDALKDAKIDYEFTKGTRGSKLDKKGIDSALGGADLVLIAAGEKKEESGEAASRGNISLKDIDLKIIEYVSKTRKDAVLLLFNGRPLEISGAFSKVAAILECWHLGSEAGRAILNVILGKVNPSGKITASFPANVGQCPIYYNHINTGRPAGRGKFTSKYLDIPVEPLFPFGFGLSYTTFAYSDLKADIKKDCFNISVKVKNTGKRAGDEVVQIYLRDMVASRVRPVKELKAFEKVHLEKGETKELKFKIPVADMAFYPSGNVAHYDDKITEPGLFKVFAGGNSKDVIETEVVLKSNLNNKKD